MRYPTPEVGIFQHLICGIKLNKGKGESDMLNIGSLVLGLIAWILPIVSLMKYKKQTHQNWAILSIISISACAISLGLQIFDSYHLVKLEDWSALMDTMGAVAIIAAVLLFVTILLNILNLIIYHRKSTN